MNDKMTRGAKAANLLSAAALALLLCILIPLALCSMTIFAQLGLDGPYEDSIRFLPERFVPNLLLTAAAIAAAIFCPFYASKASSVRRNSRFSGSQGLAGCSVTLLPPLPAQNQPV